VLVTAETFSSEGLVVAMLKENLLLFGSFSQDKKGHCYRVTASISVASTVSRKGKRLSMTEE